jgi:hypothetical protein
VRATFTSRRSCTSSTAKATWASSDTAAASRHRGRRKGVSRRARLCLLQTGFQLRSGGFSTVGLIEDATVITGHFVHFYASGRYTVLAQTRPIAVQPVGFRSCTPEQRDSARIGLRLVGVGSPSRLVLKKTADWKDMWWGIPESERELQSNPPNLFPEVAQRSSAAKKCRRMIG